MTKPAASGLDAESARHWQHVLRENGIESTVEETGGTFEVHVDEAEVEAARALFADPFAGEGEEEDRPDEAPIEVAPLAPGERTEVLAQTPDIVAAHRLVDILNAGGLYATVESGSSSSVFGADGGAMAIVRIAESQREQAFAELEAFAKEHDVFARDAEIDPAEVVEAMLLAPLGAVRVAPKKK